MRAPYGPKFFQFHAVLWKIWQNRMLAAPRGLAPPPTGNPGSAPDQLLSITLGPVSNGSNVKTFSYNVYPLTALHVLIVVVYY